MRTVGTLMVIVILSAAGHAPSRADDEAGAGARVPNDPYPAEFRARVDAAVDRGVGWLLRRQRPDGSWEAAGTLKDHPLGVTALAALACLKGGVPPRDPAIDRAFAFLRTLPLEKTYDVGVLLMALHARAAPGEEGAGGERDRYGFEGVREGRPCLEALPPEDGRWMKRAVDFLLKTREGGHWGYPEKRWDLSNTQLALLGLAAAARCGVEIPAETWIEMLPTILADQERTGPSTKLQGNEVRGDYRVAWTEDARARGFRYRPEEPVTGSMTTAGVACLAVLQDQVWTSRRFTPELRQRTRTAVRDGLAWLQDHFTVAANPGQPGGGWHCYYLYGLERAGILARTRFVGGYDWYLEGATWLLQRQEPAGSWTVEHVFLDTSFAVLFLRRSTMRARHPVITPTEPVPAGRTGK